jgi:hypothetical protein
MDAIRQMREERLRRAEEQAMSEAQRKRQRAAFELQGLEEKSQKSEVFKQKQAEREAEERSKWETAAVQVGADVTPEMTPQQIKAAVFEESKKRKDLLDQYKTDSDRLTDEIRSLRMRAQEVEIERAKERLSTERKLASGGVSEDDLVEKRAINREQREAFATARKAVNATKAAIPELLKTMTPDQIRESFLDSLDEFNLSDPNMRSDAINEFLDKIEPILQQAEKPGIKEVSGKGFWQWVHGALNTPKL